MFVCLPAWFVEMVPSSSLLWRVRSLLMRTNVKRRMRLTRCDVPRILCWWGIWTLTISPSTNGSLPSGAEAAQYGAVVSPLFTMLYVYLSSISFHRELRLRPAAHSVLLFFSGIPTAERPQARRVYLCGDANAWAAYQSYLDDTSILIPIPPVLYRRLPKVVKRTILLDFPFYQFDQSEAVDDATAHVQS